MNWLNVAAVVLVAAGLAWVGWIVKSKFDRAAEADRLELRLESVEQHLKDQIKAVAKADKARIEAVERLAVAEAAREVPFEKVRTHVVEKIVDRAECELDIPTLRLLNAARGYSTADVPAAPGGTAPP